MDSTNDQAVLTGESTHNSQNLVEAGQTCEHGFCGSATGPLEVGHGSTASHDRRWTTTTWTTVYVSPSTTKYARPEYMTSWTGTSSPGTTDEDPPTTTKWVTETVGEEAAPDPSWTTIVTSPTTTATTTLTSVATSTKSSALPTGENYMPPSGHGYALLGAEVAVGITILGILCIVAGALYKWSGPRDGPVRILVPAPLDGQGRAGFDQDRDDFYVKA